MRTFRLLHLVGLLWSIAAMPAAAGSVDIPLEAAATGTFYVKAGINAEVQTDLLLDTGSGYVSLSSRTFDRISAGTRPALERTITGILADGKSVSVPVYRIAELDLGAGCVLHNVEVAVFKNAARDILGLNALKQMQPFTLQLDPPQLSANCG
jgi:clan AA aspartic protease (TIGR02281 family)